MTQWRYALYDLLTRTQLVEHVPLAISDYSKMLGEAGTLTASLSLSDPAVRELRPRELILPRRTTLVLLRDEVVVWEGIIWTRRRRRSERALSISASELRSYFDKRRILRPELGYGSAKTLAFTSADMFDVFRAVLANAQNVLYGGVRVGDIGIEADETVLSGVAITRTDTATSADAFHGYNWQHYGEIFDALAHSDTGFEWRIDSYLDDTRTLRRRLLLGYPQLGAPAADTNVTFEYPGAIQDYEWPEDGEPSANYMAALGSGDGDAMRWAEAYNAAELSAGYPLAETAASYKDDTSVTILAGHAAADLALASGDVSVPSIDLIGYPEVSPGDHVRVRISDPDWWPDSDLTPQEKTVRVTGLKVTPGPQEKTSLIIEEPRSPGD
jgi:hypothetical protein